VLVGLVLEGQLAYLSPDISALQYAAVDISAWERRETYLAGRARARVAVAGAAVAGAGTHDE
jgi:hypothetical protein